MASNDSSKNFQLGLLYLSHILISADGVIHEAEEKALIKFKEDEKIPTPLFDEFQRDVKTKKLSAIYQRGIEMMNKCTAAEKKKAFTHLFKLCAVDGSIHVKEVKLLLYSSKMTDADLNEIMVEAAKSLPK
ncbi:MAG: hypothetical protein HY015_10410 [Bacteroidetes bacterium]|nr:hypothetical protein [Bacteroidota bacterium]MBI3483361.1 hypothetical protein [Bacteroidota bacterium]